MRRARPTKTAFPQQRSCNPKARSLFSSYGCNNRNNSIQSSRAASALARCLRLAFHVRNGRCRTGVLSTTSLVYLKSCQLAHYGVFSFDFGTRQTKRAYSFITAQAPVVRASASTEEHCEDEGVSSAEIPKREMVQERAALGPLMTLFDAALEGPFSRLVQVSTEVAQSGDHKADALFAHKLNVGQVITERREVEEEYKTLQDMLVEAKENNLEEYKQLISIGAEDAAELQQRLEEIEERLADSLVALVECIDETEDDEKIDSVVLEVRAGAGGSEAALFTGDLLGMYQSYCNSQSQWNFEVMSISNTGDGGVREGVASIKGPMAFIKLKHESGVHRVQRVPQTERQGRTHTSTATVAVLPIAAPAKRKEIPAKDLRIDTFKSSGPGGQSVNTTDSAVRITHLPTKTVVSMQDFKSQLKNRAKALELLAAKLYNAEREKQQQARAKERKGLIGSGERNERIRTYNFPQSRITDHRVGLTLFGMDDMLEGELLDEFIAAMDRKERTDIIAGLAERKDWYK